jgi:hypothetical protein
MCLCGIDVGTFSLNSERGQISQISSRALELDPQFCNPNLLAEVSFVWDASSPQLAWSRELPR